MIGGGFSQKDRNEETLHHVAPQRPTRQGARLIPDVVDFHAAYYVLQTEYVNLHKGHTQPTTKTDWTFTHSAPSVSSSYHPEGEKEPAILAFLCNWTRFLSPLRRKQTPYVLLTRMFKSRATPPPASEAVA